ncbi:MAG: MlaD family protein [Spirochaetales bacterium]|nr:MlaD family protein [Spirochaetales bacterium]
MKFKIRYADQIVGILSLIAIIALIFIIFLIGSTQKWFVPKHNYYTVISSASNISVGKSITYKGFEIGKIKSFSLDESDKVVVHFYITDDYRSKVVKDSIIEILTSPLGSSVVFYPGNRTDYLEDNSFIPERSSEEGKALILARKVSVVEQTDSINTILAMATTLVGDIDTLVKQVNIALEGKENTPLTNTITQLNSILYNINAITADPDGLVPRLLEDENAEGSIANVLMQLDATMSEIYSITASVDDNMPGISILISQMQTLLKQMQDVMEGLKNNPLLKNGISEKPEKESATPKLREDNF